MTVLLMLIISLHRKLLPTTKLTLKKTVSTLTKMPLKRTCTSILIIAEDVYNTLPTLSLPHLNSLSFFFQFSFSSACSYDSTRFLPFRLAFNSLLSLFTNSMHPSILAIAFLVYIPSSA